MCGINLNDDVYIRDKVEYFPAKSTLNLNLHTVIGKTSNKTNPICFKYSTIINQLVSVYFLQAYILYV